MQQPIYRLQRRNAETLQRRDWASPKPRPRLPGLHVRPTSRTFPPQSPTKENTEPAMKRTYQPSKIRRARTHGFLVRMKSRGGRAVINARRAKGRKRLAV